MTSVPFWTKSKPNEPMTNSMSLLEMNGTRLLLEQLGWVLFHSLWQGALVAVLLAGTLWLLRESSARLRYVASVMALAAMLALPVATWSLLPEAVPETSAATAPDPAAVTAPIVVMDASAAAEPSLWAAVHAAAEPVLPWLALGWSLGVVVLGMRLMGGWLYTQRLRRTATPAAHRWQQCTDRWVERFGLRRRVPVLQSERVGSPMVVGWWKPVVLVPLGVLAQLPPDQVETLLAHELAHIRRHDVLIGWLQAAAEMLLFYHPAAWWIARQLHTEREHCCDDLVVASGADRLAYARALTELAGTPSTRSVAFAPAAQEGHLLTRIRRLVDGSSDDTQWAQRLPLAVVAVLIVALPIGLAACASQNATSDDATSPSEPSRMTVTAEPSAPDDPAPPPSADTVEREVEMRALAGPDRPRSVPRDSIKFVKVERSDSSRTVTIITDSDTIRFDGELPGGPPVALFRRGEVDWPKEMRLRADSIDNQFELRLRSDSLHDVIIRRMDSLKIASAPPPPAFFGDRPGAPRPPAIFFDRRAWPDTIPMPDAPPPPVTELDSIPGVWLSDPERRQRSEDWADEWVQHWEQHRDKWERRAERWERHATAMRLRVDSLRREMMERQPERLREQAEQLRRQAERLEEQAREMEREARRDTSEAGN